MKLTKRNLDTVRPNPTHDRYLWDDEVRGFGLRVKPSGAQSFFIQYRNSRGNSRRFTLGKFGVLAPDEARKMARAKLAEVAKGGDPAEERSQDRDAMTVRQLCRAYLESAEKGLILGKRKRPKKPSTLYIDRGRIERHILPLLGTRRVRDLTTPDIVRFMRDVTSGKTANDASRPDFEVARSSKAEPVRHRARLVCWAAFYRLRFPKGSSRPIQFEA